MAKLSLGNVANLLGSPTAAATVVNQNSDLIEQAFDNTLSRDGATPNQMLSDFDMNHNDVLNVGTLQADDITVDDDNLTGFLERVLDAVEIAEAAAELAMDTAAAVVSNVPTKVIAQAAGYAPGISYLRTAGFNTVGDLGAGLYTRVASPPILGFQDTNLQYWELKADEILPEQAGVVPNDNSKAAANKVALQKAFDTGLIVAPTSKTIYSDCGLVLHQGGIHGKGKGSTKFITGDTSSANFLTVDGNVPVELCGAFIQSVNGKTQGAGIQLTCAGGENPYSTLRGLWITGFPTGFHGYRALAYTLDDIVITDYDIATIIENENHPDGGDSCITNSRFITSRPTGNRIGILQYNSGGLKVNNLKINGGNIGYQMSAKGSVAMPTQSTSILLMTNCSFEGQDLANIKMDRDPSANGSIRFFHVSLVNNQLNMASSILQGSNIKIGANLNLQCVNISDNLLQVGQHASSSGMDIETAIYATISNNSMFAASGTHTGIALGAGVYGKLDSNTYGSGISPTYSAVTPGNITLVGGG